jgi:putative sugar O-methyltransferase
MFKILNNKTLVEAIIIAFTRFRRLFFKKLITESESENKAYLDLINKSIYDHNTFINFKNYLIYRETVETVTYHQGKQFLKYIIQNENYLLDKINNFIQNDKIGNPKKYFYSELNEKISPTTLRYIKIAANIKKIFKDKLNNIVEIGCGYGGQYLILDNILEINKYLLIDLY